MVSHDPTSWNFSESTDLSEVLLVARRLHSGEKADAAPVLCVNLSRNLHNIAEALALDAQLRRDASKIPTLGNGSGALALKLGDEKIGEATSLSWQVLRERDEWILPAAFAQSDLTRAALALEGGKLLLPGAATPSATALLCRLDALGTLGPDARDIHDAFEVQDAPSPYPAFWSHDTETVARVASKPNRFLSELSAPKSGRPQRRANQLWPLAGRIVLVERLRLNNAKLIAVRISRPVLSNSWWTIAFKDPDEAREKALVVWLNSTFGVLTLVANRVETEGAWVKFKKPTLAAMRVLDVRALNASQLQTLSAAFDAAAGADLQALPNLDADATRHALDAAVCAALGWPDLAPLREMLAREPVVCLRPLV